MTDTLLTRLYAHHNWANDALVAACAGLPAEVLDADPLPGAGGWSVRRTLAHVAEAQQAYVNVLTHPERERVRIELADDEVAGSLRATGEALLDMARRWDDGAGEGGGVVEAPLRSADGHVIAPWVVLLQAINHATDHRRQICGQLRALDVTPPRLDGWQLGEEAGGLERPGGAD